MTVAAPDSVDWRQRGAVLEVKNQGQCGSCWSFSAAGCLEGQNALKHGQRISLSEQNLMDCSGGYGNNGCKGGVMDYAFFYVKDHGINSEAAYPYEEEVKNCRFDSSRSIVRVDGVYDFNMKVFVAVALFLVAVQVQAGSDQELWTQFKVDHGKTYRSLREEQARFSVFQSNLRTIEQHNAKYEAGEETYYLKVTQFADMTPEEFKEFLSLGEKTKPDLNHPVYEPDMTVAAPNSVDWRQKGAVLEVKNQGQCGSCWSFSATGCLEGQNAIKHGQKISLSEQNLMDCSGGYGNNGCDGGLMTNAFFYVHDHGINSEAAYPYEGKVKNCRFDSSKSIVQVDGVYKVNEDEEALKQVIALEGPVSVGVDASGFSLYGGGVFNPRSCSSSSINHGVLAVGYGTEGNTDYWIVKNSWGPGWGESGYIKMIRNHNNRCGIVTLASIVTLKSDEFRDQLIQKLIEYVKKTLEIFRVGKELGENGTEGRNGFAENFDNFEHLENT
ncbi:unnamed protein product [Callosobruchus maculatus]|uniref:Cathepsin L n=1 Tax=Callosobruchus maculatus TaxID=64391 RepID=A0A653CQI1_CALMS|nr:unnamed protein product [Callosobruchus maculatus]